MDESAEREREREEKKKVYAAKPKKEEVKQEKGKGAYIAATTKNVTENKPKSSDYKLKSERLCKESPLKDITHTHANNSTTVPNHQIPPSHQPKSSYPTPKELLLFVTSLLPGMGKSHMATSTLISYF